MKFKQRAAERGIYKALGAIGSFLKGISVFTLIVSVIVLLSGFAIASSGSNGTVPIIEGLVYITVAILVSNLAGKIIEAQQSMVEPVSNDDDII